ncbi:hypothetical protein KIN20_030764 [Parelaphostrongylus tenuis]|uniref:Thioesterase domain-containing protein n=1 Tax=Parelaphostrongylus tenuis TaxID=148309 RepID=A0AAD5WGM9_PARTN|nr:hypothetical protein KIN20_030764 [Parelaphostrongylus tenuis]
MQRAHFMVAKRLRLPILSQRERLDSPSQIDPWHQLSFPSVTFLPVKAGELIEITAYVLKLGRNIAFTEAEFRRKSDGKLAAKGRHTVAILPKQPVNNGEKVAQY